MTRRLSRPRSSTCFRLASSGVKSFRAGATGAFRATLAGRVAFATLTAFATFGACTTLAIFRALAALTALETLATLARPRGAAFFTLDALVTFARFTRAGRAARLAGFRPGRERAFRAAATRGARFAGRGRARFAGPGACRRRRAAFRLAMSRPFNSLTRGR